MSIQGGESIKRNLKRAVSDADKRAAAGVVRAQLLVRSRAVRYAPVLTGNLRNSATTPPPERKGKRLTGRIGFTAAYAPYVHENVEATFNAPGTGARFLARALEESRREVLALLRGELTR